MSRMTIDCRAVPSESGCSLTISGEEWAVTGADRNAPDRYVQIVGFPDHESAMANSKHPATSRFAEQLGELCEGEAVFHDLDVRRVQAL